MDKKYILAIDQGTTGSRALILDHRGKVIAGAYREFKQYFPKPGWVEHDAEEIWASCAAVIKEALTKAKIQGANIRAIGITNQRETTVLWDRRTSRPVHKAIVWQCRRTAEICKKLKNSGVEPQIRRKTGLLLDPYFSGTKVQWLLDHVPGLRARARSGNICFGTMDSWLIWKLTGGASHVTDMTNASRTLFFNIKTLQWDPGILKTLRVPQNILPKVQNSGSIFGHTAAAKNGLPAGIPITAVMGDQQAALYGQGCFKAGMIKNTYGTGCFLVLNTGKELVYSKKGLLSTVACDEKGAPVYALEGSIFMAGAVVQWLRDQMGFFKDSAQTEKIIKGLKSTDGVYLVPAFTGMGAPYWKSEARGLVSGITRGTTLKHMIRAGLEAIAYQAKDVFDCMQEDFQKRIPELRVDGGACRNNFLMQFQADMLGCRVIRPRMTESTVYGAAYLAGVTSGLWRGESDLRNIRHVDRIFKPKMLAPARKQLYDGWREAVKRTIV